MSTMKQRRIPSDVVADRVSTESLSFTALVCVQEQKKNATKRPHLLQFPYPPKAHASVPRKEPEFEFSITAQSPNNPINITSTGWLNPNKGQFQAEPIPSQKGEVHGIPKRGSKTMQRSRTNGHGTDGNRAVSEKNGSLLNREAAGRNKKPPKNGFRSFVAPCRLCRVQEPDILHGGKTQR